MSAIKLVCYPYWLFTILQLVVKDELHVTQCLLVALCAHHYHRILAARENKPCGNMFECGVALTPLCLRCKGFDYITHTCASLLSAVR